MIPRLCSFLAEACVLNGLDTSILFLQKQWVSIFFSKFGGKDHTTTPHPPQIPIISTGFSCKFLNTTKVLNPM